MNLLKSIVDDKRVEIASRKRETKLSSFFDRQSFDRFTFSLRDAVNDTRLFSVIAEIKRSSPSAGVMKQDIQPDKIAQSYRQNGASAISVLTDKKYFNGTLQDLAAVRDAVPLPILRKEFIIDEYQIAESKAFGADAILLIAGILDKSQLDEYHHAALSYGLETLVELYDEHELDKIDFSKMKLIGVNNRDLRTMEIDLNRTTQIASHLPSDITVVSESGVRTSKDLKLLKSQNIHAALIGELFMKSPDPGLALGELLREVNE